MKVKPSHSQRTPTSKILSLFNMLNGGILSHAQSSLVLVVIFVALTVTASDGTMQHNEQDIGLYGNDSGRHDNESGHHNDSDHGDEEHHGVQLAGLNLEEVRAPLIITLFMILVATCKLGFHHSKFLSRHVPESCLLIVLGTLAGLVLHFSLDEETKSYLDFSSELFFLYLLPPIILESAYSLHDRVFFDNLGTILLFAVIGTILNCFLLSPILYGLAIGGAMGTISITLVECFVFGALIVAVDPVAVLAIFQEVGVNNVLYFLVFGESLLNDAVTIVLYNTMREFNMLETIPWDQILLGIASFFTVSLGGLAIGIVVGGLCAFFTRFTRHVRVVEPLAIFSMAYLAYILAELFHFSGIISIICCGLMQAQYAFHNLSNKSLTTVIYFGKALSTTADSIIFLFLGLSLVSDDHVWHWGFVMWTLFLCLFLRFVVVYGLMFLANKFQRLRKLGWEEQFIMAYGGLRGAVAFSLIAMVSKDELSQQPLFETTTLAVIIFTVFIQGMTIKPLVTRLRITTAEEHAVTMNEEIADHLTDHITAGIEEICGHYGHNYLRERLDHFDNKYIRRLLMRNPSTNDQKIMEIYQKIALDIHKENVRIGATADPMKQFMPGDGDPAIMREMDADMARHSLDLFGAEKGNGVSPPGAGEAAGVEDVGSRKSSVRHSLVRRRWKAASKDATAQDAQGGELGGTRSSVSLLRSSVLKNPSRDTLHRKYDRNLTGGDRHDLLHHLHEKRKRHHRQRMSRHLSLSQSGSLNSSVYGSGSVTPKSDAKQTPKLGVINEGATVPREEGEDEDAV